jgi:hypothetical protein
MKMRYLPALFILLHWSCQDLESAKETKRETFMHFYEGAYSLSASNAEVTDDGYIISGTVHVTGNKRASRMIIIKTDFLGRKQWEKVIDHAIASSITKTENGYIVTGHNAVYNPSTGNISELENYTSRLIVLDQSGNVVNDISSYPRKTEDNLHIDYYGNALTINGDKIISLGSYQEPGKSKFTYLAALHPLTLDTLWMRQYNYIVRDYENARSLFSNGASLLWGTSITEKVNTFNYSYLAVPMVLENSTFVNSSYFGQNQDQQALKINDFRKGSYGYAAIGTYSKPDGANADMFFIRIDPNGNFVEQSISYFDALSAPVAGLTAPSLTDVRETGEALTSTHDGGFVLAGTLTTDEGKGIGNGGNDIWLIKIDGFGTVEWSKIIGGPTNERVASITETADKGLLICGTIQDGNEQSGGLSSIFLIKTDRNGALKN